MQMCHAKPVAAFANLLSLGREMTMTLAKLAVTVVDMMVQTIFLIIGSRFNNLAATAKEQAISD